MKQRLSEAKKDYQNVKMNAKQSADYIEWVHSLKEAEEKKVRSFSLPRFWLPLASGVAVFALAVLLFPPNLSSNQNKNVPSVAAMQDTPTALEEEKGVQTLQADSIAIQERIDELIEEKKEEILSTRAAQGVQVESYEQGEEEASPKAKTQNESLAEVPVTETMITSVTPHIYSSSQDYVSFALVCKMQDESVPIQVYYNLALETGETLTLEMLLGEEYQEVVTAQLRQQADTTSSVSLKDAEQLQEWTTDENQPFYINETGEIVVLFMTESNPDEANGEDGKITHEVVIPTSLIESYLVPTTE